MRLLDLRRYAVREGIRIHFYVEPAGECFVNDDGVLKIPSLARAPDFCIDAALPGAEHFTLSPMQSGAKPRTLTRAQLEALLCTPAGVAVEPEE